MQKPNRVRVQVLACFVKFLTPAPLGVSLASHGTEVRVCEMGITHLLNAIVKVLLSVLVFFQDVLSRLQNMTSLGPQ